LLASDLKGFPFHKNEQKRANSKTDTILRHIEAELKDFLKKMPRNLQACRKDRKTATHKKRNQSRKV
jgi:hypothetical protein